MLHVQVRATSLTTSVVILPSTAAEARPPGQAPDHQVLAQRCGEAEEEEEEIL